MDTPIVERTELGWVAWQRRLRPFLYRDMRRVAYDLITTLGGYALLVAGMVWVYRRGLPYGVVLAMAIVAAGLLVRLFIFFHDACHHAYMASRWGNTLMGTILGVLVFTPYHAWRTSHLHHHTTVANLDRRGAGDVWTMTVSEFESAPWLLRTVYYLFRQPWFLFTVAPVFNFVVLQRFPSRRAGRRQNLSVLITDLGILALAVLAGVTIGLETYIAVQLPIIAIATLAGTWLFYVQHQFQGVYWARDDAWDPARAALDGSSYYRLPPLLQWMSGNIGFHHVHHLTPRMPYYQLERAHCAYADLSSVRALSLRESLACARLSLWDETEKKLVSFASVRHQSRQR